MLHAIVLAKGNRMGGKHVSPAAIRRNYAITYISLSQLSLSSTELQV